jgi:uncharacterized protein
LTLALIPDAKIILFGSRARGDDSHGSDVDIALDAGRKIEFVAVGEVRDVLEATNIPYKVDVLDFYSVSKDMQEMISKEGIQWN